jgi:tetratricopeptide (TPR) repeat protein
MSQPPSESPASGVIPPSEGSGSQDHVSVDQAVGLTLPPPAPERAPGDEVQWLAPIGAGETTPVPRRSGPRAHRAALEARLARATRALDSEAERRAAVALARWLAARGVELDRAARLARRALVLGEDSALRSELSTWFSMLGQHALAAVTLLPIAEQKEPAQSARTLVEVARLLARAGRADDAVFKLERAAECDPQNPEPLELIGLLGSLHADSVSADQAATALVRAAAVRETQRDRTGAFEDLLRAFETLPSHVQAAERLAASLLWRGRSGAADEVLRSHARASGPAEAQIHARRMREALQRGDVVTALVAAFDARSDATLDPAALLRALRGNMESTPPSLTVGFDELLERLQLLELLAARLEVAIALSAPEQAQACRTSLARMCMGPLAEPQRAGELWVEALAATPDDARVWKEFERNAAGDLSVLIDAVEWVARSTGPDVRERQMQLGREVLGAAQRLGVPHLALWAADILSSGGQADERVDRVRSRYARTASEQDEQLGQAIESALARGDANELERCAHLLKLHPRRVEDHIRVLDALAHAAAGSPWLGDLQRLLWRHGRDSELEQRLERGVSDASASIQPALALLLARSRIRRGELALALDALRSALTLEPLLPAAAALAAVLAAHVGDEHTRARALERLAQTLPGPLRAGLTAVAAEAYWAAGEQEAAWQAAERACESDASSARAVAARATIGTRRNDPTAVHALEKAVEVVVARASMCAALTRLHEQQREPVLAVAWAQRWLGLRPGDQDAVCAYAENVARLDSTERVVEAAALVLSLPCTPAHLAQPIGVLLDRLVELDPAEATALAWRTLETLGPGPESLRKTISELAARVDSPGLVVALHERWVAAGAEGAPDELLEIARRRRAASDADGTAHALLRALEAGAAPRDVLAELELSPKPRSSDGELVIAELRARALASADAEASDVARAWRELGAVRWDLGWDQDGAIDAWERASLLDPEFGLEHFACDLAAFGGHGAALERLDHWLARYEDSRDRARVLAVQAAVALQGGQPGRALRAASQALELDPSRVDMVVVAERSAKTEEEILELERTYRQTVDHAMGRYGVRALHYRAARHFERVRRFDLAAPHALEAFAAVPSEGAALALSLKLAELAPLSAPFVDVLARAARESHDLERRRRWLRRAAELATILPNGHRSRVELLAELASDDPTSSSLQELVRAFAELAQQEPGGDVLSLYQASVPPLLRAYRGEAPAQLAVDVALFALGVGLPAAAALSVLSVALERDAAEPAFARVIEHVGVLLHDSRAARAFAAQCAELMHRTSERPGEAALEAAIRLAVATNDEASLVHLLAGAARHYPGNAEWLGRLLAMADRDVRDRLLGVPAIRETPAALLFLAKEAAHEEQHSTAITALERLRSLDAASAAEHDEAVDELRDIYAELGRREQLESLMASELQRGGLDSDRRARLAAELAALVAVRGAPERALMLLRGAFPEGQLPLRLMEDARALARQAGDRESEKWALLELVSRVDSPERRLDVLRELALFLDDNGESAAALSYWSQVLALAPDDPAVALRLTRDSQPPPRPSEPPARERIAVSATPVPGIPRPSRRPPWASTSPADAPESSDDADTNEPLPLLRPRVEPRASLSDDAGPFITVETHEPTVLLSEQREGVSRVEGQRTDEPASESERPRSSTRPGRDPVSEIASASGREERLFLELVEGNVDSGKRLVEELSAAPERSRDLATVCRRVALLLPGDAWPLTRLVSAALADHNPVHASAVQHILHVLGHSPLDVPPPPLSQQPEQPQLVQALLLRDSMPANEALATVWEGAERLLHRDLSEYGVTGLERVGLNAPTLLGQTYAESARALGLTRVPLFQRRSPEPFTIRVALLSTPGLIASGEVIEHKATLDFAVGSALAAAMPNHAVLFGMPEAKARELLEGLALAFGPPSGRNARASSGAVALAEMLWQTIPGRDQRRLGQLCENVDGLGYEAAVRAARRAARRAGLYVSGDLAVGLRRITSGEHEGGLPPDSEDLARTCAATAGGRDLFGLAISPEFAEMRWRGRPANMPLPEGWGNLRP